MYIYGPRAFDKNNKSLKREKIYFDVIKENVILYVKSSKSTKYVSFSLVLGYLLLYELKTVVMLEFFLETTEIQVAKKN